MTGAHDEASATFYRRRTAGRPITPNEIEWIEFIRLASGDTDPPPTLSRVQRLRQIFQLASS
ncbi:hypothetical protein EN814_23935 [Mesorhizobium sp. M2D.F.Ca.ET.171.01.1.1]|nr:hypothetical protein EN821_23950 [Mesorhizobium sp. M2D.F.Ca.ET.178.01.1.1]TGT08500.1 hypothetical protein EN814_23935 [Mesorhizobium sp. M2D.F.Ca.ET.171.01.1.1]